MRAFSFFLSMTAFAVVPAMIAFRSTYESLWIPYDDRNPTQDVLNIDIAIKAIAAGTLAGVVGAAIGWIVCAGCWRVFSKKST